MRNNKTYKIELTIREDLNINEFLDKLNDWMIEKNFINPIVPMSEFPEKYKRKEWRERLGRNDN